MHFKQRLHRPRVATQARSSLNDIMACLPASNTRVGFVSWFTLRSHKRYGVEPSCERTYNGHRHPVFGLHPLSRTGQHIASCDGCLHVWDVRTGLHQFHLFSVWHVTALGEDFELILDCLS